MKKLIKIPYSLVLVIACLILTFAAAAPVGAAAAQTTGIWGVASTIIKVGPIVMAVLILAGRFVKGRVVPEIAAVVCYVLGAAYLLLAFKNVMNLKDVFMAFEGDMEAVLTNVVVAPIVCQIFSGWIYFLVAARIQDEEVTGGHGALGTLGCIGVIFTAGISTAVGYSIFNVIPMILQLGYIKRLPVAFTPSGGATTVRNILYVVVMVALFFVGPTLGIGI